MGFSYDVLIFIFARQPLRKEIERCSLESNAPFGYSIFEEAQTRKDAPTHVSLQYTISKCLPVDHVRWLSVQFPETIFQLMYTGDEDDDGHILFFRNGCDTLPLPRQIVDREREEARDEAIEAACDGVVRNGGVDLRDDFIHALRMPMRGTVRSFPAGRERGRTDVAILRRAIVMEVPKKRKAAAEEPRSEWTENCMPLLEEERTKRRKAEGVTN